MSLLTLENRESRAEVALELGCEPRSFKLNSGVNLFFKTPWAQFAKKECDCKENDEQHFIKHYHGGMQLMFPNAGYASTFKGIEFGYHGESWQRPWILMKKTASELIAKLKIPLINAEVIRQIEIADKTLKISDQFTNLGTEDLTCQIGYHPAFSAEFLNDHQVVIHAKVIDVLNNTESELPYDIAENTNAITFKNIFDKAHSFLAIVSDFQANFIEIINKKNQRVAKITFDDQYLKHAWIWIEVNKIYSEPWNSETKTFAFEPCTSKTNLGLNEAISNNLGHLNIAPGESVKTFINFELNKGGAN